MTSTPAKVLAVRDGRRRRVRPLDVGVDERRHLLRTPHRLEPDRGERREERVGRGGRAVRAVLAEVRGALLGDERDRAGQRPRLQAQRLDRAQRGPEAEAFPGGTP